MGLHYSPTRAKKLWSYLRAVFFMMRKGLASNKRKLLLDMNLFMKRGNKILGRSLTNLIFHHHHHHPHSHRSSQTSAATTAMTTIMHEYEFSCSNSPNPVFSRGRRHAYFPCLNAVVEDGDDERYSWPCAPAAQKRIEYSPQSSSTSTSTTTATTSLLAEELFAPGERRSPSPTSVRIAEYYSDDDVDDDDDDDEEEEEEVDGGDGEVDDEAEEFIRRFYEQLRAQRRIALLEYQEEYHHMLARGDMN